MAQAIPAAITGKKRRARNLTPRNYPMKIVVKTNTNQKGKKCNLCKRVSKTGQRSLYKPGAGGYYGTPYVLLHLSCLAEMLLGEPEFQDPEVANAQFEEYRNLLLERYAVNG